jgi:hypothetical protein
MSSEQSPNDKSESDDPAHHDEVDKPAGTVANSAPEGKQRNNGTENSDMPEERDEAGDVTASHLSNPIPAGGGETAIVNVGDGGEQPPPKKKRVPKPKEKLTSEEERPPAPASLEAPTPPSLQETEQPSPFVSPSPETKRESSDGKVHLVAIANIVMRAPFSTLLPVKPETLAAIKSGMEASGFDPTHPVHLWEHEGALIQVDGRTRTLAAGEVGITHIPAFIHHFKDEPEALGFSIRCQMERRNITQGEMFALAAVYDEKVKPGSTQQRGAGGTFAPRASNDANRKTAEKTAELLNTTGTNIERTRYLLKYADDATKAAVTNNKMTLSRACEVVRKQLAPKKTRKPKKGPKDNELPFELTPDSDVAFAVWNLVACAPRALSEDPKDQTGQDEPTFTLDEARLNLTVKPKALKGLPNRRVLVSTACDLFAPKVPTKIVRTVLETAANAKQFQFLFTTRNPGRLVKFSFEANMFCGVSIFVQQDVAAAEAALLTLGGLGKWLVVEQLTMELTFKHLDQLDWLVVRQGAGVRGADPDTRAMKSLLQQASAANCPVLFERGIQYRPADAPKVVADAGDKEAGR